MTGGRLALLLFCVTGVGVALLLLAGDGDEPASISTRPIFVSTAVTANRIGLGQDELDVQHNDVDTPFAQQLIRDLPVEGCKAPARAEDFSNEQFRALMQHSAAALSESSEPDSLVAAALLTSDAVEQQHLLERALAGRPGHPIALWHVLVNCQERNCDRDAVEAAALAGDPVNGMVWFLIASDRIKNGQWDDAEFALRQVAAAPRYSLYFMDVATLIERGLAATTHLGYSERVFAGIGTSAATAIPSLGDVSRACQSGGNDAVVWIDLCEEAGQRLSAHGEELIMMMFGYGLRSGVARRAGDDAGAETIRREGNERINGLLREQARSGAQALMTNDSQVLQSYVENFLAHGEVEAMDRLNADARRLRADSTYNQCNFVGGTDLAF